MPAIVSLSWRMICSPPAAASRAWLASSLACAAFSAFLRVIAAISSSALEVSSRDEACSLAPAASCWLAPDTCPAASPTWFAPSVSAATMRLIGRVMLRVMVTASNTPITTATANPAVRKRAANARPCCARWASFVVSSIDSSASPRTSSSTASPVLPRWMPKSSSASQSLRRLFIAVW